ncbi:unnamed protein product [Diplocarpon coronariae]|nr:hypothetical protein JHW43_007772 [Diplocarpon mali]
MPDAREKEHQPFLNYTYDGTLNNAEPESGLHTRLLEVRYSRFLGCALTFLFTSAIWLALLYLTSSRPLSHHAPDPTERHNITSTSTLTMCPNSTTAARAAGCKYDLLLNHWIPSQCWDQDYLDEYIDDGSWAAFEDEELTQPITTKKEMEEREFYWTSARDHINHCATMWKKQFTALFEESKTMDSLIASPGHTDHCAQYLMDATRKNVTWATRVEIGFAGCWVKH